MNLKINFTLEEFKEVIDNSLDTKDYAIMHKIVDELDELYYIGEYSDRMDKATPYYPFWRYYFDAWLIASRNSDNFKFIEVYVDESYYKDYNYIVGVRVWDKFMDSEDEQIFFFKTKEEVDVFKNQPQEFFVKIFVDSARNG